MEKKYILTKEQFLELKKAWKQIEHRTSSDHILYNLLRSKSPECGFTEKKKNILGNNPWYAYNIAISDLLLSNSLGFRAYEKQHKESIARFSKRFGVEFNEEVIALVRSLERKHGI